MLASGGEAYTDRHQCRALPAHQRGKGQHRRRCAGQMSEGQEFAALAADLGLGWLLRLRVERRQRLTVEIGAIERGIVEQTDHAELLAEDPQPRRVQILSADPQRVG